MIDSGWLLAHVQGIGDACFKVLGRSSTILETILDDRAPSQRTATIQYPCRLVYVDAQGKLGMRLMAWTPQAFGLVEPDSTIEMSLASIVWWAEAPESLAQAARKVWIPEAVTPADQATQKAAEAAARAVQRIGGDGFRRLP